MFHEPILLIPEPPPGQTYPIPPGQYTLPELAELLREYAQEPEVIQFIANMLEP
jgi:hypothetical protein